MTFHASDPQRFLGRVVGNGHCVAFVREAAGAPHTSEWRRGALVRGSAGEPGTAIATFDPDGRYGNHVDGRSHAAILVAIGTDGLLVWDQWLGQPVHQRVIRYRAGRGDPVNDGDVYHAIEALPAQAAEPAGRSGQYGSVRQPSGRASAAPDGQFSLIIDPSTPVGAQSGDPWTVTSSTALCRLLRAHGGRSAECRGSFTADVPFATPPDRNGWFSTGPLPS